MVRISHHDGVISLFDLFYRSNIVPNVVSYKSLILAHYEASRVDSALRAYREMLENATFSPSAVTYHHLTKGLVAAGCIQDTPQPLVRDPQSRQQQTKRTTTPPRNQNTSRTFLPPHSLNKRMLTMKTVWSSDPVK
ncbi:hypothetical protein GUJ93_ZPchr0010g8515 [Zizania palustris]|uniref:Pentatricopeptide repeat-containing protein n=1 Tax=Zizania palustris TaxID=103762 RepID=A0A8J6BGU2_ZIZPA|nr:hypothetical protein GUJ93_ZPchr0010g8515 [Zizania palustris]